MQSSSSSISWMQFGVTFSCCVSQDWQEGGKSEVYLWGNGRYGQLAGVGTNLMIPTLAPSLLQTQQVHPNSSYDSSFLLDVLYFLLIFIFPSAFGLCLHGSGCVWTELLLPAPVQRDSSGCGRGAVWQTGPGEF